LEHEAREGLTWNY